MLTSHCPSFSEGQQLTEEDKKNASSTDLLKSNFDFLWPHASDNTGIKTQYY